MVSNYQKRKTYTDNLILNLFKSGHSDTVISRIVFEYEKDEVPSWIKSLVEEYNQRKIDEELKEIWGSIEEKKTTQEKPFKPFRDSKDMI